MWSVPPESLARATARLTASAAEGESSAPTTTVSYMGTPSGIGREDGRAAGPTARRTRSGRLDDEHGAGRLMGDGVGDARQHPALHPLVAHHDQIGLLALGDC